jgi:YbbR domain-containing protein
MKDLLRHNWHLKLISLGLAAVLWAQVARAPTSEIGVLVSLEYQNIPRGTDVVGDNLDRVEVRLRGPSWQMRALTPQDISVSVDVREMSVGQEKIVPLTPDHVHAPFGTEVVRVIPGQIRLVLEPRATR